MTQRDMFSDDLSFEDREKLAALCRENNENIEDIFKNKIGTLAHLQKQLAEYESHVDELKRKISAIEEDELPNLMDELMITTLEFNDGLSITLDDKVYFRVNAPEREIAWKKLVEMGAPGIIKPVLKITVAQTEGRSDIIDAINIVKNSLECDDVQLTYEYNPMQLSALMREFIENCVDFDDDVFKQSVKRGVKIKQKSKYNRRKTNV